MAASEDLNELFGSSFKDGLPVEVSGELKSMLRLYSITPQELFYKWESYSLKMGAEDTNLDLDTVRMFKKDVQDSVEREHRGKGGARGNEKRSNIHATPKAAPNADVYGMLDELTPNASYPRQRSNNGASMKRKAEFDSPTANKYSKASSTPRSQQVNGNSGTPQGVPFSERQNAGQVTETLNNHLSAAEAPIAPFPEPRIKTVANTDVKKFGYKPMSMRLSDSSEVLDERIDEFMAIIQKHHNLEDSAFGSAVSQSTSEIVAVGRIACDTAEGKLNSASTILEMSRRMGAGLRVPLKLDKLPSYQLFPGQIVAVRGTNPSGEYFSVSEILEIPLLPPAATQVVALDSINEKLGGSEDSPASPLSILIGSGPYTADNNLDFEPLKTLCEKAAESMVDALVLTGPFLDLEHPLLAAGDFDLPDVKGVDPNEANISTLFRLWIAPSIQKLVSAVPTITIILAPSARDIVSKHVSWPEDSLAKKELGLPLKQVKMVPNPVTISFNETVIGISSQDILYQLRREELFHGVSSDSIARLSRYLIEQRHFFPLFPPTSREALPKSGLENGNATGAMLDIGYLKLGEWLNVKPDILIIPSYLPACVKVVESVLVINPNSLSKRKGAGTFAQVSLHPRTISDEERENKTLTHKVFERARVEMVRI
ncbi:putative dna polymerase alpha primase associated subunit [Phaeomoniella chlamydospora]|uniref:DNA polymerase alpha subunit B n=1 Tax=Phaeomoniella chlamydospora TaxID=158046 RepID=A0A0G2EE13_PHACM|nr:putative dna polymerase alpha primase associated subunit [Phaeomoniella chlamydospora]